MKPISTAILAGLMTGSVLIPNAAQAAEIVQSDDVVYFEYRPYELKSTEGRVYLLKRINAKARAACRSASGYGPTRTCRQDLAAQWMAAIDSPTLSTHLQSKGIKLADARP